MNNNDIKRHRSRRGSERSGAILAMAAVLMVFFMGLVACAFDLGWIVMTRTELQAAADASTLAGGTELMPGLGMFATKTPAEVAAAARPVAVQFAGYHRNGQVLNTYADPTRDVRFGWAEFNSATGQWTKNWNQTGPNTGYNMIQVTLHRDQVSTTNDDGELPLFIAPVVGKDVEGLAAAATAVILPANGFRVVPGDPTTADIIPFTMSRYIYEKYLAAQADFAARGGAFPDPIDPSQPGGTAWYTAPSGDPGDLGDPLYGHYIVDNGTGNVTFKQDFEDLFSVADQGAASSPATSGVSDKILEVDLYPRDDSTAGNFGTIDLGNNNNSTTELSRQIADGLNESDFSHYTDNAIIMPLSADGETGLSTGIKAALDTIVGECRALALFDSVNNPGDTASFQLTGWAGMRLVEVQLTGALQFKHLRFQLCQFSGAGAIGDTTDSVDENTTVFTPLILIE